MTLLQITSPDGNTTEEEQTPSELASWLNRAELAQLRRDGHLNKPAGGRGMWQLKLLPSAAPAADNTSSRVGGLYFLMVTERGGAEYVTRYSEAEMDEVFNPGQRRDLAKAGTLTIGGCRYVDMVAAARTLRD